LFSFSASINQCVDRHDLKVAANRFPSVNRTSAASIEKPIHNVKVPMDEAKAPPELHPKMETCVFIPGTKKPKWWSLSGSNR
jgi:hypothetical protein